MSDRERPPSDTESGALSLRALAIGTVLVIANAYWLNLFRGGILHVYISLFANTVFCLFWLALINLPIRRLMPGQALRTSEILAIYAMVVMVSTICGNANIGYQAYILPHPFRFASVENDWANLFLKYIPDWLTVQDESILQGFYDGESSFFAPKVIRAWAGPMLAWSAFMFVMYLVLMCMNTVVRRQFTDYERLTYPITWLPLEMGKNASGFFGNRVMWIGFALAAGIELLNGLSALYPTLPSIPVKFRNVSHLFNERPWDAARPVLVSFYPFAIGLAFFMPLDLAFSSWFFYLFGKAQVVGLSMTGLTSNVYLDEQSGGAWIVLGLLALWMGRRHFGRVLAHAFGSSKKLDDSGEPMPYRWAVWGAIVGIVLLLAFGSYAGMSIWASAVFLAFYFLMALSLTKVRAGLGPPLHELYGKDPGSMMVSVFGSRAFGPRNLTLVSFYYWMNRVNVAHPMPNQLEAFRIGEQANVNVRKLVKAMLFSLVISIFIGWIVYFNGAYTEGSNPEGGFVGIARECFGRLERWLTYPTEAGYAQMGAMATGFGFTMLLSWMKMRFLWWPFHPIGYVIGMGVIGGDMGFFWLPVMISWLLKSLILKHGGLQAYRRAVPFFAGLILGDYVVACIWSLLSAITGRGMYWLWV